MKRIIERYREGKGPVYENVEACKTELATNFWRPASSILEKHAAKMCMNEQELQSLLRALADE